MLLQQKLSSPNDDDDDSLTDVSVLMPTKPSSINHDQISKYPNNFKHDQLFQSLIAYANSFKFDETIYSVQDYKNPFDSTSSIKQTQSIENSKSTGKLIPSHFFSTQKTEDYNSDENTTITNGSKFEWEYLCDTLGQTIESSDEFIKNYQLTNKIKFEQLTPIIIREKTKDIFIQKNIDVQFLRSSTPIIVREILRKPSPPNRAIPKYHLPPSSNTFIQNQRSAKPPIFPKRKINDEYLSSINKPSKKIIIEYDQINVTVDKNIQQRKEIKRINPNEYVQQYGSSLYSNEVFHNLFTNLIA